MPDISMCGNDTCPSRARCYRHEDSGTEPTPGFQSYSVFDPGDADRCDVFMQKWEKRDE